LNFAITAFAEDSSDTGVAFYAALAQETGGPVLEIACGTGRVAIPIARRGFAVTGLDVVPGMLERARRSARRSRAPRCATPSRRNSPRYCTATASPSCQSAQKFNSRYATLGFSDKANLDEGAMWPTSFALKELTGAEEAKIGALVKRAVS
jgi:SAM-dependent methyltransferase